MFSFLFSYLKTHFKWKKKATIKSNYLMLKIVPKFCREQDHVLLARILLSHTHTHTNRNKHADEQRKSH